MRATSRPVPERVAHHSGHSSAQTLPFGRFYGTVDQRLTASGLEVSLLTVDPHRVVERHSHDDAHFVFVLDGLYVSSAQGAPAVSRGEALVFNPPGTTHRDRFEAHERVMAGRFLTLSLSRDLVEAAEREYGEMPLAVSLASPSALAVARRLTAASRSCAVPLMHESLALALMTHVSRTHCASATTVRAGAPAWLSRVRAQLDDSLGEALSIRDIARTAGVHPVHLARVFRRHMGVTPGDYHRRRRLEQACVLLRETRRPLADIAHACGFVDQAHFTAAFRRAMGAAPGAYRASLR